MELQGKKAVVCGSTQGIGLESAKLMAKRGANITMIARNEQKLKDAIELLDVSNGQTHDYLVADFSKPNELKVAIDEYISAGNLPHILVNNSGGPKGGPIVDAEMNEFIEAFNQHLICNH